MTKVIIGVVGHPSSGKDTVSYYLADAFQFSHVSTGDLVRFYISEHGLGEPTRALLHDVSNTLRAEHGPSYLVQLALEQASDRSHLVVSGLRTVSEARYLQE